jgi:NADH-quinone oxidoreductase subunit M
MMLPALIVLPAIGALICYLMRDRTAPLAAAAVALGCLVQGLVVMTSGAAAWNHRWIPSMGINLDLAVHPYGVAMLVLTPLLTFGALCMLRPGMERRAEFCGHLLLLLASLQGLFLADNLGLFYVFFELMLLPSLMLTSRWGGERGRAASVKFLLYTLMGSLPMLLGVLSLGLSSTQGSLQFAALRELPDALQQGAFWLFTLAFLVKLPIFPLHGWQVDLYRSAPAPVVAVVAGAMSKAGAYGLLRVVFELFPTAAEQYAPVLSGLALVSLLYGAVCALGATDLRGILAYSSLSHLSLVTLAIFVGNEAGRQGAVLQMFAHGVATGGLFLFLAALENRGFTSELRQLGGLARTLPQLAALGLVFAMASLGCPGLCSFPAELAMLLGISQTSGALALLAALGVILAAWYGLRFYQGTMNGPAQDTLVHADLTSWEWVALLPLAILCFAVGLFPDLTILQWTRGL